MGVHYIRNIDYVPTDKKPVEELTDEEWMFQMARDIWGNWMNFLFSVGTVNSDWSITIPSDLGKRWSAHSSLSYEELTEEAQDVDRGEVARMITSEMMRTIASRLAPKSPLQEEKQSIDPDTAITAFMGWLTSRDEVSGPFSSRHDPSVKLIEQFCEAQGWHASNERFHQQIKLLKMNYPGKECPLCDDR